MRTQRQQQAAAAGRIQAGRSKASFPGRLLKDGTAS
jgi:hypothetical protein